MRYYIAIINFTLFRAISCAILYFLLLVPSVSAAFSSEQKIEWQEAFVLGKKFVAEKLSHAEGGIYSNYLTIYPPDPNAGVNHEITSESMGLILNIAAESQDRVLFEKSFRFLKKYMVKQPRFSMWKLNEDLAPASFSSTTIDDLNIIRGLFRGYDVFGDIRYRAFALSMAETFQKHAFRQGVLVDAVSWDGDNVFTGTATTLPFVDFATLRRIKRAYPPFSPRFFKTYRFFFRSTQPWHRDLSFYGPLGLYDFEKRQFIKQDEFQKNFLYKGLWALHMAEIGKRKNQVLNLQKAVWEHEEKLYARPYPDDIEDMAFYGIITRVALRLGDDDFAAKLADKIVALQIKDPASEYKGAFLWKEGDRVYSYSQLQALYALGLMVK